MSGRAAREHEERFRIGVQLVHAPFDMLYIRFHASALLHGFQYPVGVVVHPVRIVAEPDGMSRDDDEMLELCVPRVPLEGGLYAQRDRRLALPWTRSVVPPGAGCVRVRPRQSTPRRVGRDEDQAEVEQERARECEHKQGRGEVGEPGACPEGGEELLGGGGVVVGGAGGEVRARPALAACVWEWEHGAREEDMDV